MLKTRVFSSIAAKLILAVLISSAFFSAYAVWSVGAITRSSDIVKDTYDKPLQALNFARSANASFYSMQTNVLRGARGEFEGAYALVQDDLDIARERSLSDSSRRQAVELAELVTRWRDAVIVDWEMTDRADYLANPLVVQIEDGFTVLAETLAADSFLQRQVSVDAIDTSRRFAVASIFGALALGLALSWLLARYIIRPLRTAATAADRISNGDFTAEIALGPDDETGAVLHSMRIMQGRVREMLEREEARAQSAETRMIDALEKTEAAVLLLDEDGRIRFANSAAHETAAVKDMSGWTYAEALGAIGVGWEAIVEGAEVETTSGRWLTIDRSLTSDGGSVVVWTDVSELKDRETRLKIAIRQAEAASAAKTRFLGAVSHELKTPLNSVIGFADVIKAESFGPLGSENYREYADYIVKGGRRLLELVTEVLEIARTEDDQAETNGAPIEAHELLTQVAATFEEQERARIDIDPPEENFWIWGGEARLVHALRNIVSNALKFSDASEKVTVSATSSDAYIAIRVVDHGVGMRPEDVPLALSAFDQLDGERSRQFEGAGTGLPFAKSVIESLGGRIEIQSSPGEGATVTIYLFNADSIAHGTLSIPTSDKRAAGGAA